MGKYTRKSRLSSLTIVASLLLGFSCTLPVAFGKEYHVVAGSQVIVRSVNQQLPSTDETRAILISNNFASSPYPFLGGFSLESGVCSREPFTQIDGWNGISINSVGIIAGFTGSITGGVTTVFEFDNQDNKTIFQGGLLFDSRGFSSGTGNINTEQALHYGCATFRAPYPAGSIRSNNVIYGPSNNDKGNKVATVDGDLWIYVEKNVPVGTKYNLQPINISQGSTSSVDLSTSIPLTLPGDTIVVIPPPCTISTSTVITFDASSVEGRKVSAPITYKCSGVDTETSLDAYLVASAISETPTPTELALTIEGNKPGGVVRGYVGQDVDIGSVNCTDTINSLNQTHYLCQIIDWQP